MSAKFIAQIVTSPSWAESHSAPRAERDEQDRERYRPREHLRLEHRFLVRLVEVSPERGGTGQAHLDSVGTEALESLAQALCGVHHLCVVRGGARTDHRHAPIGG